MTRAERLQEQLRKHALRQAQLEQLAAAEEAKKMVKAREENNKRRYRHGSKLDEKGFFALEEATLDQLFDLLVPLIMLPDPVSTLDRLVGVPLVLAAQGVEVVPESHGAAPSPSPERGQDAGEDARPRGAKRTEKLGAEVLSAQE
jgi:hypothetical protein